MEVATHSHLQDMILYKAFAYIEDISEKKFAHSAEYDAEMTVDPEDMVSNMLGTHPISCCSTSCGFVHVCT